MSALNSPRDFERYLTEQLRKLIRQTNLDGTIRAFHDYKPDLEAKVNGWLAAKGREERGETPSSTILPKPVARIVDAAMTWAQAETQEEMDRTNRDLLAATRDYKFPPAGEEA